RELTALRPLGERRLGEEAASAGHVRVLDVGGLQQEPFPRGRRHARPPRTLRHPEQQQHERESWTYHGGWPSGGRFAVGVAHLGEVDQGPGCRLSDPRAPYPPPQPPLVSRK